MMKKTILRIVLPEASDDNQLEVIFLNEDDSALFEESCRITDRMHPIIFRSELTEGQTLGGICIAFEDNEPCQVCILTDC